MRSLPTAVAWIAVTGSAAFLTMNAPVGNAIPPRLASKTSPTKTTAKGTARGTVKTTTPPVATKTVPGRSVNVKTEVETKLAAAQKQASPGLDVGAATCPPAMAAIQTKAKTAASKPVTFRCTVLVEGVAAPYDVEIRDGGFANGGSFLISRAKAFIDIAKVVDGVKSQLDAADRATATVSCGKRKFVVASIGDTLTCAVDYGAAKGVQKVQYVVKDLDGTIALKL